MEKIKKEIEFELTGEEIVEKAMHLADLHGKTQEVEEELKGHKKRLGDIIKENKEEIARICRVIEHGKEIRLVDCEMEKDFDTNTITYFHNGVKIDERAMEPSERQQEMFQDEAEEVFNEKL